MTVVYSLKASSHGQFNDCELTKLAGNELGEKLFRRENAKYAVSRADNVRHMDSTVDEAFKRMIFQEKVRTATPSSGDFIVAKPKKREKAFKKQFRALKVFESLSSSKNNVPKESFGKSD